MALAQGLGIVDVAEHEVGGPAIQQVHDRLGTDIAAVEHLRHPRTAGKSPRPPMVRGRFSVGVAEDPDQHRAAHLAGMAAIDKMILRMGFGTPQESIQDRPRPNRNSTYWWNNSTKLACSFLPCGPCPLSG